ncbi:alcohol dehydrogenase-like [Phlebotomus papatasi]|uniref:alcohol dehydrogenase-like n=1 Tax=Phlebotomus papatasi TaxID=29031 RepID=UPI002483492D|nr:alcohol dehydrogenase-like [Phlebotomus papatasi]
MSFVNKSALVTGGTGGIGAAICEEFLKEGIIHLAALDLYSEEPKIVNEWRKKFPGVSIKYFKVDVTSQEYLKKCYAEFTEDIENLDIVVNCAGIMDENLHRKTVEVNLCGVIGSTFVALDHMRIDKFKGKGGAIVNISSISGVQPLSIMPTYAASKQAVITFTRCLAHGRNSMGIKFLTLCPGGTQTNLVKECFNKGHFYETDTNTIEKLRSSYQMQSSNKVSEAVVKIIEDAQSGSVWVINCGQLTEQSLDPIVI